MFGSLLILVIMCSIYSLEAEPTGMVFYLFVTVCLVTVYYEITQATNITLEAFVGNLVFSLIALVGVSVLITIMLEQGNVFKPYILLGSAVIVVDALISPIISFKMALRNISISSGG